MDRKWNLKNLNLIAVYVVMLQYHIFDLIEHDSPSRFNPWNLHFAQALSRAADLLPAASAGGLELEDFMDALDLAERLCLQSLLKNQPMALQTIHIPNGRQKGKLFLESPGGFWQFLCLKLFSEVPWFEKQWWCSSSSSWEAAEITGAGAGEDWQIRSLKRAQFQPFLRDPLFPEQVGRSKECKRIESLQPVEDPHHFSTWARRSHCLVPCNNFLETIISTRPEKVTPCEGNTTTFRATLLRQRRFLARSGRDEQRSWTCKAFSNSCWERRVCSCWRRLDCQDDGDSWWVFFKGTLYNGTYILKERKSTWEPSRKPIHLGQCGSNLKGTLMIPLLRWGRIAACSGSALCLANFE